MWRSVGLSPFLDMVLEPSRTDKCHGRELHPSFSPDVGKDACGRGEGGGQGGGA